MRLFLDAHVSGRGVGGPLRERGHDVRAIDQEPDLEGLDDDELLRLAAGDMRILVTFDVGHFPRILRDWAEAGRSHAGIILVYGIGHAEFGVVVRGIERWLEVRPEPDHWVDFAAVLHRKLATP